ncbi:hypothetical protein [Mastigocoleus sp. MO_188.B34]|uniref:hypothetical protein n=1 Tax=Mastigocoleus sp. MO_188.B34 TaxID=3036635 RepID=UPI0026027567|nr:hypothetical protein [Mastigocoleus sp. MO_188.B34]MDJ0696926.1 hypothetical protein [Mastigocoleus sp. MO_188.B34]
MKEGETIKFAIGKEIKWRGSVGGKTENNSMDSEAIEKLRKAIYEPERLKGTVRIGISSGEDVYRVTNGSITTDKIAIEKIRNNTQSESISQKSEKSSALERIQKQMVVFEQQIQQQKLENNPDKTLEFINKLQEQIQNQQESIEKLTQALTNTVKVNAPNPENSKLQNFVGSIERKVKEVAKGIINQVKKIVQPKIDAVKSKIDDFKSKVKQKVDGVKDAIDGTKNTITSNVSKTVNMVASNVLDAKGKVIEASVGTMLKAVGEKQGDGSISFSSENYNFRMEGDAISVHRKSDGAEILNKGEFTSHTLKEDLKNMEKVESVAQKYTYEVAESQQQQQSKGISR